MSNEQVKSVAKKANTEVATVDFEQYADIGFENIGSKDLALPFLKILSQLSPQVTMGDAKLHSRSKSWNDF
jgi:hypothetical protein